jgi:hypothetical protein
LRLEIDRITAQQMRGEPADMRSLIAANEALERLLKPDAAREVDNEAARNKLAALVAGIRAALIPVLLTPLLQAC